MNRLLFAVILTLACGRSGLKVDPGSARDAAAATTEAGADRRDGGPDGRDAAATPDTRTADAPLLADGAPPRDAPRAPDGPPVAIALIGVTVTPGMVTAKVGDPVKFTATGRYSDGSTRDVTSTATWSSSAPMVATIGLGVAQAFSEGSTTIRATVMGISGTAILTVGTGLITAIEISPAAVTLSVGGVQPFTATALFSNGSKGDVTASVVWESSDQGVLSFSPMPGLATARAPGTAIVTARLGGISGSASVMVTGVPLIAIRVLPLTVDVPRGATQAFRAAGVYADGRGADLTASVVWSSGDPAVATISSQGVATALRVGATRVVATLGMVSGMARMTVSDVTITGLSVTPKTATLAVGGGLQLTATATFSDGSQRDVTDLATWSVSDPGMADISNGGRLTARRAGGVAVTATFAGLSDAVKVSISAATLITIVIGPPELTLAAGQRQNAAAVGTYSDGSTADVTEQVTWSIDDPMVATVSNAPGASGVVTGVGEGATKMRARLDGQEAASSVVVTAVTLTQLSISPINPSRRVGEFVQFGASAIRSNNTSQNVTMMATWTSSDPAVAPVTTVMGMGVPRGRATCLALGTTTITASYMGLEDSTVLTCNAQPMLIAVQVTPFLITVVVGQPQPVQATALFSDGTTQNVNMMSTWTSSDPMVAGVSNLMMRGVVTGLSAGTATITATYMGVSGDAQVTVVDATLVRLSLTPALSNLKVGQQQQLMATAIFSDNTVRNVTGMTIFSSRDRSVADVANGPGGGRGQVTALGPGTTTIAGSYMGFTDDVVVTVTDAKVTAIQVTPTNPTILLGSSLQFQAVAVYSDFTIQNVTGLATWESKDAAVADVSNAGGSRGTATGLAAGNTPIAATFMGVTGSSLLTVSGATIKEIQVTPVNPRAPMRVALGFTATAILSDGSQRNVTAMAAWTSSDPAVVDVSNAGGRGMAFTLQAGTATIQATLDGVTGSTLVTVGSQTLSGITVTPAMATIAVGAAQQFAATGNYSDGSTFTLTAQVTWLSSDPDRVAAISNAAGSRGLAVAVGPGTTSIAAHFQGLSTTATLAVTP